MIAKNDIICFLGDSITQSDGTTDKFYWEYIAEMTGATVYSFGVNGAQSCGLSEQLKRMEETVGGNFDILFVFVGTNDFNHGVELGDFFTVHEERVPINSDANGNFTEFTTVRKRDFVFDRNTFKGRLNIFFSAVREKYSDKRIVMLTPIHRAYAYFGGDNIQPDELFSNKSGLFFDSYIQAEREAADIWSIEIIDLYLDSGLFPICDGSAEKYFHNAKTDRLHPNAAGHRLIAEKILQKA